MLHSLCGTLWMSLEAAFNIPMPQMFALFHSVMCQPKWHSLSCGHLLISTKEVSGVCARNLKLFLIVCNYQYMMLCIDSVMLWGVKTMLPVERQDNTIENVASFQLSDCTSRCEHGHTGIKTLFQENPAVYSSG